MPTSVENPSSKEKVLANCAQFIYDICNDQFSTLPYPEYSEATISALEVLAAPSPEESRKLRERKIAKLLKGINNNSDISLTGFQEAIQKLNTSAIPTDEVIRSLISVTGDSLDETIENPISTTKIEEALNAKVPNWSTHTPISDTDLDLSKLEIPNISRNRSKVRQTALHIIASILTTGMLPKENILLKYDTSIPQTLIELKAMELELKSQKGHGLGTDLRAMRDFMRFLHSDDIDSLQNTKSLSDLPSLKENTLEEILTTLLKKEAVNVTLGEYRNIGLGDYSDLIESIEAKETESLTEKQQRLKEQLKQLRTLYEEHYNIQKYPNTLHTMLVLIDHFKANKRTTQQRSL